MKRRLFFLVAVLGLAGLVMPASAQERKFLGPLSEKYYSPMRVLELKAGCHFTWMPKALKDTGIDPAKVHRLPVGTKIYLNHTGSCKEPMTQVVSNTQVREAEAKLAALRDTLAVTTQQLGSLRAENVKFKVSLDSVKKELADAKKAKAFNLFGLTGWSLVLAIAIVFAAVGALLMFMWLIWSEPRSGHGERGRITIDSDPMPTGAM